MRSRHSPPSVSVRHGRPLRSTGVTAVVALIAIMSACGGDDGPQPNAERFCGEAIAHTSAIVSPPVGDEAGLAATLDFYRLMGDLAPLSITEQWNQLVVALETANEFNPADPDSEQVVVATAYAMELAAYDVKVWLERNCGLEIPITTIAPHGQTPAAPPTTTTTVAIDTTVAEG